VHLLDQMFGGQWVDLIGWVAFAAGLAAVWMFLRRDQARKQSPRHALEAKRVMPVTRSDEARQLADVAVHSPARALDPLAIQARAAEQVDAAEHAFNRMLAECGSLINPSAKPALKPVRQVATETSAPASDRQSLAA
jgi:hypothetical protein